MIDIRLAARSLLTAVAVVLGVAAFIALASIPAALLIKIFGPVGLAVYGVGMIIFVIAFCLYQEGKDVHIP